MSNRARPGRLLLFALLLLPVLAGSVHAGPGWWGDLDKGAIVDLNDVIATPLRYEGKMITFFCIFRKQDRVFMQRGTPFTRQKHENIAVWPDGAAVWDDVVFAKDFPFLYVQRAHYQRGPLINTPAFTRIEVTGRIRAVVQNRPFIEVISYRVTGHRLGKNTVLHIVNANTYAGGGNDELAVYRLMEALRDDLPPRYDIRIRQLAAKALRRLGREEDADRVEAGGDLDDGDTPSVPETDQPRPDSPRSNPLMSDDLPGSEGAPEPGPTDEPIAARPGEFGVPPGGRPLDRGALPTHANPPPARPLVSNPLMSNPLMSNDLPGTPVNPFMSDDLPGAESGSAAPRPGPILPRTGTAQRPTTKRPTTKPTTKPRSTAKPRRAGAPPKRRPRLVGVK